uniref:Uncharacterized protein n=1 Tax=Anguilla anguilla TaxID=7936 RepID=A0A0E9TGQ2_ANGAN
MLHCMNSLHNGLANVCCNIRYS